MLHVPAAREWFSNSANTRLIEVGSSKCSREFSEWSPFPPYLKPFSALGVAPKSSKMKPPVLLTSVQKFFQHKPVSLLLQTPLAAQIFPQISPGIFKLDLSISVSCLLSSRDVDCLPFINNLLIMIFPTPLVTLCLSERYSPN